ncbi:2-isopropylmalate synthase [Anaeromyxobacter oryzae]|uniref:2-isopropylmalate synthase n=1 Tax=Anaeromyxobacter oryzae TaxID=2918170 RepID=A0ABN6N0R6_9BACT|nr:2-isopropylmalate synthase [Anaeromyxobacter oryzae]BDG06814.1 2-isopropylmalate synthase [Anaeromyxobacter oryzae]
MSESADRVVIFDTTLRDGEQSPGASMNLEQKLQVARALRDLGVDVIEAGFAAASPGDLEAIRAVGQQVEGPVIASLARCNKGDIDASWQALKDAPRRRCHVFLATSPIHRDFKLKMAKDEIIKRSIDGVKYARERFEDVEFSAEDSARTELEFLAEVVERAIEAGARTVNIPDTVGYALPVTYAETIRYLVKHVRGIDKAIISVHCHNDLGLAVANSLAGVMAGARQVECTINGIGERAGNASLEEVVMAFRTRHDVLAVKTGVKTERLYPTSRLVSQVTGLHVQRNKAIVGQNAFAHEAGIHQHGMLTHRETYEIMRPEEVGFAHSSLVLGKHSGRHALKDRLVALGYQLDESQIDKVFQDFKILADKKKDIYDADIEALVVHGQILGKGSVAWELEALSTTSGTGTLPCASVALRAAGGGRFQEVAAGDGPVDAVYRAIEKVTGVSVKLRDYQIASVSTGEDAQGEVTIEVEHPTGVYRGRALSTDIIEGSARAFLDVVNRIALKIGPPRESEARTEMGTP